MQKIAELNRADYPHFIEHLTIWVEGFSHASILNSNNYDDNYGCYELLAGVGAAEVPEIENLAELSTFYIKSKPWLFGHIGYDYKNKLENLTSQHREKFTFEDISFFCPKYLIIQSVNSNKIEFFVSKNEEENILFEFINGLKESIDLSFEVPFLKPRMSRLEYLNAISNLKIEIQYGNIYEINYCQEFYAENVELKPSQVYLGLIEKSPMPFSAYYKAKENFLMCASPERYIAKRGEKVYSQPIKGTIKRGLTPVEDKFLQNELRKDLKEQTENVMIVDLVRNDLSKTAVKGSVRVEELFGVYPFPQVHQLISTVSSKLKKTSTLFEVLETTFPMGSMTGAPKISAMQLADKHEYARRELYSGTVGYINPEGDFDFNVVIRSLIYSSKSKYLSLTVGGAITDLANAEKEYEECLLKAKAVFELQKK